MSSTKRCRTISLQSTHDERRYFRVQDAAEYISATVWFIYTLTWKKAIPFTKIGKRLVFDRVDLDTYMQNAKTAVV